MVARQQTHCEHLPVKYSLSLSYFVLVTLLVAGLLAGCDSVGIAPPGVLSPTAAPAAASPPPDASAAPAPPTTAPTGDLSAPEPVAVQPSAEPENPTATPAPALTPTPEGPLVLRVAVDTDLPQAAIDAGFAMLEAAGLPAALATGEDAVGADADLTLGRPEDGGTPDGGVLAYERVLVVVDRFSTLLPSVSLQQLQDVWTGEGANPNYSSLYPSQAILGELTMLLGEPSPNVKPQPADQLADALWADPMGLGLLPFDALTPRVRALPIDNLSAVNNRFDPASWPLTDRAWLTPQSEYGAEALTALADIQPATNRDPSKLTVLVMTGVTAMSRGTAAAIEQAGDWAFPARVIGPDLAAADLTTTSNEAPFLEGCKANNTVNNMTFCSRYEYWDTLKLSGIDVIGLTGNHLNDWGYDALSTTLQFYQEQKIPYYGGGIDEEEARKPLVLEHNGNRLGFIGANPFGPPGAWAGEENPGSARYDPTQMAADVQKLKGEVDLVFAELQHTEVDAQGNYSVNPLLQQVADFDALSQAGADVVTGIQAHAPQSMALRGDKLIFYGLGNLYFDQTWSWQTRTGVVVRYTIYDHRLLGAEPLVTVIEMDKQLRWATPEERVQVLKTLFTASGW